MLFQSVPWLANKNLLRKFVKLLQYNTYNIFTHNIAKKIYCHKMILLSKYCCWISKLAQKFKNWHFKFTKQKKIFCKNCRYIVFSKYLFITIMGVKIACVTRASECRVWHGPSAYIFKGETVWQKITCKSVFQMHRCLSFYIEAVLINFLSTNLNWRTKVIQKDRQVLNRNTVLYILNF